MLKTLYALQQLEVAEHNIEMEKQKSAEVLQLRQIKAAFLSKKTQYQSLLVEIAQLQRDLESLPQQILECKEKVDEERAAIYDGSVMGMKELDARELQAAAWEKKAAELEEMQATMKEELQKMEGFSGVLKGEMALQYKEFSAVKSQYLMAEEDRQQRLQELARQKADLLAGIDAKDLEWFHREQKRFHGTPIAKLGQNQVCSGCHTMVPPVVFSRTMKGLKTCCENCGRILFIAD